MAATDFYHNQISHHADVNQSALQRNYGLCPGADALDCYFVRLQPRTCQQAI